MWISSGLAHFPICMINVFQNKNNFLGIRNILAKNSFLVIRICSWFEMGCYFRSNFLKERTRKLSVR